TDVQLVNGSIDNIAGHVLSVSTNTGLVDVQIAEDANIETEGKGTPTDLQPGVGVAITGRPDGSTVTALSIRIIPAGLGTPRPRRRTPREHHRHRRRAASVGPVPRAQ